MAAFPPSKVVVGGIAGSDFVKTSSQSKMFSKNSNLVEPAEGNIGAKMKIKKSKKDGKKKRKDLHASKKRKIKEIKVEISSVDEDCSRGMKFGGIAGSEFVKKSSQSKMFSKNSNLAEPAEGNIGAKMKNKKSKKDGKKKRKDLHASKKRKTEEIKVDQISSVDEDCSRGMKKWLIDYKVRRPGLKVLQQRIDEFMTAYEEQQEQERKEREARVAEEGWTVVVHQKGRKKSADSESGITVGSVSQAAVMDNVAKKKNKEVGLDFYRFQRRDAKRNEVLMMQSKFEQDKKRIQQLRAARKFRPY